VNIMNEHLEVCRYLDANSDMAWADDERYKKTGQRYDKVVSFHCRNPKQCKKRVCVRNGGW
jgi:hypothetical protein